jgi:PAS domain S-box-containing protein
MKFPEQAASTNEQTWIQAESPTPGLLDEFLDSSPDAIIIFNRNSSCVCWNRAMESLLGILASDLTGHCVSELLSNSAIAERKWFSEALRGKSTISKARAHRLPGTAAPRYFDSHFFPLEGEDGKIVGGMALFRDVTGRAGILAGAGAELEALEDALELEALDVRQMMN